MTRFVELVRMLAIGVFGRWEWHPPAWATSARENHLKFSRYLVADWKRVALLLLPLLSILAGVAWYKTRPAPHYVQYTLTPPALTEYDDNGIASIKLFRIAFSESAAPLRQVEKRVATGIDLSPQIAGSWFWINDKELSFTPKSDWPVDGEFAVRFAHKGFFANGVELEDYKFGFRSQPFSAKYRNVSFIRTPAIPISRNLWQRCSSVIR